MADPEHLERLTHNFAEWNEWRRRHPDLRPDLSGANLTNADLMGADLRKTDLSGTDLSGADLWAADLRGAVLRDVYLRNADFSEADFSGIYLGDPNFFRRGDLRFAIFSKATLSGANLEGADLTGADLRDANLSDARLNHAILNGTRLNGANLTRAHFYCTIFSGVNLSDVRGLETATHYGPSTVDINKVLLPHDEQARLHFLRGVGFTETQIEYLPSLLTPRPVQYQSLFISYASQDEVIAEQLHIDLRRKDVLCWFAPHDLQPGNYFRERIDRAIRSQDRLLLLLSEHSVKSGWVRYEVEQAIARENREQREILYPICLDDGIFHCTASWAVSLQATRHIGDFTGWKDYTTYQQAFTTLLHHLKTVEPSTYKKQSK